MMEWYWWVLIWLVGSMTVGLGAIILEEWLEDKGWM